MSGSFTPDKTPAAMPSVQGRRQQNEARQDIPTRIVSLVPSHTESLHDLGFAHLVVGRTRFCIHPEEWVETIPHVGGTKDASLEKILELEPDLVVVDKDENPIELVEALHQEGVEVIWSEIDAIQDAGDFLMRLADRCGDPQAGVEAADQIRSALAEVTPDDRPTPVFCPVWHDPWMTFDRTAYPHAVLDAVGFHNVFGVPRGEKYFEVTDEEVAESGAEVTLLPTEPFPFHKKLDNIDTAGLGTAGEDGRVHVIDGEALTWFGTRTAKGLRELAKARDGMKGVVNAG